jgi:WD40 repeat protein
VQPDRPCYIERSSDAALWQSLQEQRFCYVLGPKSSGKTSLMAHTIRRIRSEGQLAAVVDLAQIGARGESAETGRWYYSIAYRIVRELRLKVDLQTWWQGKSVLMSEQRLTEFFWEIVLANTTTPVTIFFDEAERALQQPFSRELFAALGACYSGRATEPDYLRLNFVVLGVATARQLGRGLSLPLFEDGRAIELEDFSLQATYQLSPGVSSSDSEAKRILERVYHWVKGQPYLTQKIARAVARRGGTAADVDAVVREQFLSTGARDEEPLLNHVATVLTEKGALNRRALVELGRLAKGTTVVADPDSPVHELLRLAGLATTIGDGYLTYRNRVLKSVFTSRWVKAALPFDWRGASIAAAVLLAMILLPVWYTQIFPRPYISTLTTVTNDLNLALDTYDRLRRFPGFAGTADRLLADVMRRRSANSQSYAEIRSADEILRRLPGQAELADELMSAYWFRRAEDAVRREQRDDALAFASLALPGQGERAADLLAGLIDGDYPALARSFRSQIPPSNWKVDWARQELTVVDQTQLARRISIVESGQPRFAERLTAPQHVPLRRELGVDEPGSAGLFSLQIDIEHPAEEQLMLTLEAPSGERASFRLPSSDGMTGREIRVTDRSALAVLADEDRQGVWQLTLVDQTDGAVGRLVRWGLLFAEELRGWEDVPEQGVEIPDPVRTDQVQVELSDDGRLGVAWPSRPGAVGSLTLWDLNDGVPLGDIQLDSMPQYLALTEDASRLVTLDDRTLQIWDTETKQSVARIATQSQFALTPAIAIDGEYVAIAEQLDSDDVLYSLLRASDGELVASVEGLAGVRDWLLGPQARYLVLVGPSRLVRVLDPRRGDILFDLRHERDPVRVLAPAAAELLLSVDALGDIFAWRIGELDRPGAAANRVGTTVNPASVSVAADGSSIAFEAAQGHVVLRNLNTKGVSMSARIHGDGNPIGTALSPGGRNLLSASGGLLQLWRPGSLTAEPRFDDGVSVVALDASGQFAALGFQDGHVEVRTTAQLQEQLESTDAIAYIGHQGTVTSVDIDSVNGMIASGGSDSLVRIWNLASGVPTAPFMRHSEGPIQDVELSSDGRWLGSAAEYGARFWGTADGELALEVAVNGTALAVGIAPDAATVAVGDSAGNVFISEIGDNPRSRSGRAQAAVTALTFAPDGQRLATGDRSGRIQLWDVAAARPVGAALAMPHAVRWLQFSDNGQALIVQTDHWVHVLDAATSRLSVINSRLMRLHADSGGASLGSNGDTLRLVGGSAIGAVYVDEIRWQLPFGRVETGNRAMLERDWSRVLGLEISELGTITASGF